MRAAGEKPGAGGVTGETLVRSSPELLSLPVAADCIPLQIWVLSDAETYSFANAVHASFLGRSPSSFLSSRIIDVLGMSPGTDHLISVNRDVIARRESLRTEEWVPDHTGSRRLLDVTRTPVSISGSGHSCLICTASDVTARYMLEQQLSASEHLYGIVVNQSRDGIYVYSGSTFKFVNDRLCEMLGYPKEELLTLSVESLVHPEDRQRLASYGTARSNGTPAPERYQARIVNASGDVRDFDFIVSRIPFEEGIAAIGTVRDVTGQQAAQRKLEELSSRTVRMDKLLSVGELAGGIAHDFNNLLTGILGNIQLARPECGPDALEHLTAASGICREAAELTGQLLVFSSGGDPIRSALSVPSILREVVTASLEATDITCSFDLPEDLMSITADKVQFIQVVRNLVSNAVCAMPEGGRLSVSAINMSSRDVSPGMADRREGYLMISIADTGTGIDEESLPRIFDPFFSTTSDRPGAGLGLSIVYSVVRKHEGYVMVESEPAKGTCFKLYFPAAGVCEFNATHADSVEKMEATSVLLMDDEEMIRSVSGEMLDVTGFATRTASDGLEAYEKYRRRFEEGTPFDVVILDLTVPDGMGGKESMELIRKLDPEARIIVSSGYSNSPVMSRYSEYGFNEVLRKPYTITELRDTVLRALRD